ncbi:hypothetical protein HMI56_005511 [Coelomomyces lativittatus]|nr:hypothetical protein HMI56_005511 [Coelomomyces lativittatus]
MIEGPILHSQTTTFASKAIGFSIEEITCLNHSLLQCKVSQKLPHVQFWGKLITVDVNRDYYVALMHAEDPFQYTVFYCQDTMNWVQAPTVSDEEVKAVGAIRKSFSGDPALEHLIRLY